MQEVYSIHMNPLAHNNVTSITNVLYMITYVRSNMQEYNLYRLCMYDVERFTPFT